MAGKGKLDRGGGGAGGSRGRGVFLKSCSNKISRTAASKENVNFQLLGLTRWKTDERKEAPRACHGGPLLSSGDP